MDLKEAIILALDGAVISNGKKAFTFTTSRDGTFPQFLELDENDIWQVLTHFADFTGVELSRIQYPAA
jgi:hypothetical protein